MISKQTKSSKTKLPISAFVASHNEGHLLEKCLAGLDFCSEIFVMDLESTDNTKKIAESFGAKVLHYPKYPVVEYARCRAIPAAAYDWLLLTDPDEVIDQELSDEIRKLFDGNILNYQAVYVPVQFYFKNQALKGTVWGGWNKSWRLLYNKNYTSFSNIVHQGIQLKKGAKTLTIQRATANMVVHHYWMTSYSTLIEKHNRYIRLEGKRLYENGVKYSIINQLKTVISSFRGCFFVSKGYKDNFTGLFLSIFWAYYNFMSWYSLYKFTILKAKENVD